MTIADDHIVATYSKLLEGLSSLNKIKLIEKLSKSISEEKKNKEKDFYKSFGAFSSDKSAEEIVKDIRESRKFRKEEIKF